MAASADRPTTTRSGERVSLPVKAATRIFAGTMVAKDTSGWAVPARATATDVVVGIAQAQADNSGGSNGDISVEVERKTVGRFANSASGDLIAAADRLNTVYAVDDVTVAKTSDSSARPAAGKCIDVDAAGVWVEFS
jgi:hypothetical protein